MSLWTELLLRRRARRDAVWVTPFHARVPSKLPDAYFGFEFRLTWASRDRIGPGLQAEAERRVRETAERIAKHHSVLDPDMAKSEINIALNQDWYLLEESVLSSIEVTARVNPADRELAEELEAMRRTTAASAAAQDAELDRLRILGDRILADPALARLWWMDGKRERLSELPQMEMVFERVAELITSRETLDPQNQDVPVVSGLIRDFLSGLESDHRQFLLQQLAEVFKSYERHDLADRLNPQQDSSPNVDGRGWYASLDHE